MPRKQMYDSLQMSFDFEVISAAIAELAKEETHFPIKVNPLSDDVEQSPFDILLPDYDRDVLDMHAYLLVTSYEDVTRSNCGDVDRMDVLCWMFGPVYVKQNGKLVHVSNIPFSFWNCCKSVGIDLDVVRDRVLSEPSVRKFIRDHT